MPLSIQVWRVVALIGTIVVLLQQAISAVPLQPRQEAGLVVLVLATIAVVLTLVLLLPTATARLRRCPDLLIPLGLLVFAEGVLGWLLLLPATAAILAPSWAARVAGLSFTLSLAVIIMIVLNAVYGTWVTLLILQAAAQEHADPPGALSSVGRWFWRVLGLEVIGWGVILFGLGMAVALAAMCLPLGLVLILVGTIVWSFATAALLPVALDSRFAFGEALRRGVRLSWQGKSRWWLPLVAQLVLQGLVTFVAVSYSATDPKTGMSTTYSKTNWGVNGFWTGGYDGECRWYDKVMETLNAPKLQLISTLLGLLFGVLVIAVKLRIVEQLLPPLVSPTNPPPGEEFPAGPVPPEGRPSARGADGRDELDFGITPHPDLPP